MQPIRIEKVTKIIPGQLTEAAFLQLVSLSNKAVARRALFRAATITTGHYMSLVT